MAQNYPFMHECTSGSAASLGSCLCPALPPDQLLGALHGCSGSPVFSMMQAVCPLGWGYRWLAGQAQGARSLPPADCGQPQSCADAHCLLSLILGRGLAGGKVPPESCSVFTWHRLGKALLSELILTLPLTSSVALGQVTRPLRASSCTFVKPRSYQNLVVDNCLR